MKTINKGRRQEKTKDEERVGPLVRALTDGEMINRSGFHLSSIRDWQEWQSLFHHNGHAIVFYLLVERVRDAEAACFDLFHLIGQLCQGLAKDPGFIRQTETADIVFGIHQKMIYYTSYVPDNICLLMVDKDMVHLRLLIWFDLI